MATAASVMTRSVLILSRASSLEEAARALSAQGISGAPVCDDDGHLVGVISHAELADAALGSGERTARSVAEAMSVDVLTAAPDDDVAELARRMVFEGAHRAVVLDASGAVAGIVSPLDLLRVILDGGARVIPRGARFPSWPPPDATR